MSEKKLKIKLSPNGELQMETVGVKGKKCLDYIELLKKMVDVKITNTELTSEYYESEEELTEENVIDIKYE